MRGLAGALRYVGYVLERVRRMSHDNGVGIGSENLVAHVGGQAVVYAQNHHKRAHAKADAENRHQRNDVDERLLAPGKEIAQRDEGFKAHAH